MVMTESSGKKSGLKSKDIFIAAPSLFSFFHVTICKNHSLQNSKEKWFQFTFNDLDKYLSLSDPFGIVILAASTKT